MAQEQTNEKLRKFWWIALTIATVIGFYMIFTGKTEAAEPQKAPEMELRVTPFLHKNINAGTPYIGYISPVHQVELVPNVSGYISKVLVKGGQDVKAGDKLVVIDQREYQAAYDAAKANLEQASATFANAKVHYDRLKKAGEKAVSKTELDNAKSDFLSARGALEGAKANLSKAKVMLDYTVLQSSIDGTVGNVDLTVGNYVSPNSKPLLSIVQYNPIRVVFSISDKEYLSQKELFPNYKIKLKLADGSIYDQDGIFQFTENQINTATNAIAVYADFVNPNKDLVANAYVDVLLEKEYKNTVVIPQSNAYLTTEGAYIYLIRNNQLLKVELKILDTVDNQYVVANQFEPNDYLVLDKVPQLSKNTKIKPKLVTTEDK